MLNLAIKIMGLIASIGMPFFNIPLIIKIHKRRSAKDISLVWMFGVWACILLMTPSALVSSDLVFKIFGIVNLALFTAVVYSVIKFK